MAHQMLKPVLRQPIQKVVFTCDLFRFRLGPTGYRHEQVTNLRWLCAVLGAQTLWPDWGVDVRVIEPPESRAELEKMVKGKRVLDDYEADSQMAWARRFDGDEIDVNVHFAEEVEGVDLVIGFELPPAMKRFLQGQGIRYISFHIHALRFLPDLCLGAVTNDLGMLSWLEQQALPDGAAEVHARRYMAQLRRHPFDALHIPDDWPLLIAQTARDSILIDKGRFADWPDFEDRIADLLQAHSGCVLLEHPFRADTGAIAQYLRARFDKTVLMTNANGYGVLFQSGRLPAAITLSSSLGVEALTVGVPTTFLLGNPVHRMQLPGLDLGSAKALHHGVLAARQWKALFGVEGTEAVLAGTPVEPFELGHDYLRGGMDSWSYAQLQQGFSKARSRKVIYPSGDLTPAGSRDLADLVNGEVPRSHGWEKHEGAEHPVSGVEVIIADAPVNLGEHRIVTAGDPWSNVGLEGFHAAESWGAWSAAHECSICIAVAPSWVLLRGRLRVRLSLRLYQALSARCPVCRVSYRGQTLALALFRPAGQKSIDVEFTVTPAESRCVIDVVLSDADSPYNVTGASDTRTLGIGLCELEVQALDAEAAEAVQPTGSSRPERAIWGVTARPFALPTQKAAN